MDRHETRIEDATLYIEHADDWLRVGDFSTIFECVGGKTYAIEYDDTAQRVAWLSESLDDDNTLTIDVREALSEMSYTTEFVNRLADVDVSTQTSENDDQRVELFVDLMTDIWDSKGNVDGLS